MRTELRLSRTLAVVALLGLGVLEAASAGETKSRLAVVVLPAEKSGERTAALLNHLAQENFGRAGLFVPIDLAALLAQGTDDPRAKLVPPALAALQRGRELYDNMELDSAIEELTSAAEGLEKVAALPGVEEPYQEARLFLGAAYFLASNNPRGIEEFKRVALYDRRRTLDPRVFPPSMIEFFKQACQSYAGAPTGTVLVRSNPPAAEVYLNGVFKGITPLTLADVTAGVHFLRLVRPGYLIWGQQVSFVPARETTQTGSLVAGARQGELDQLLREAKVDLDEDPPEPGVVKLGRALGAERLAIAIVEQDGDEVEVEAALIQVSPPKLLSFRAGEFSAGAADFLPRVDAFFSSLYRKVKLPPPTPVAREGAAAEPAAKATPAGAAAGAATADLGAFAAPRRAAGCRSDADCAEGEGCEADGTCLVAGPAGDSIFKKWWFWTLVGGTLAVAGGTTALILSLQKPGDGAIEFSF